MPQKPDHQQVNRDQNQCHLNINFLKTF